MPEQLCLEDGLNDAAVIRTAFESFDLIPLDLFPQEDPIHAELQTRIAEARGNLISRLQVLHDRVQTEPGAFLMEWEKFRTYALDMMTRGYPRLNLDSMMKLNLFDEGGSSLYYFEAEGLVEIEKAWSMPAHQFAALLINEVLQSARNPAHYADRPTFDRRVFQKYVALMFITYATTDPMFYGLG